MTAADRDSSGADRHPDGRAAALIARATASTLDSLFDARVGLHPDRIAVEDAERALSYRQLAERSRRAAGLLAELGITRGERVALLAENRLEHAELLLAAARLGAIVACQPTRAAGAELGACLDLVSPRVIIASPALAERHAGLLGARAEARLVLDGRYESALSRAPEWTGVDAQPEDTLVIIYTSGTTGLPKGARISHRAEIVRSMATNAEYALRGDETFVAWSPLSHMGALDNSLSALIGGGKVIVVDGFDADRLAGLVGTERLGWLLVMPGTAARLIEALRRNAIEPVGVRQCGVMPDLVPPQEIAELTTLLRAPYANTFGTTETGCPPCSGDVIEVGVAPTSFPKRQSGFCEIRLVDGNDEDVPIGVPGEICMRGPTLFSGYWDAEATNAEDFRGGWFHLGDVLVRHEDSTLEFVDRVKYLIKSGGENIYPAEIERTLLRASGVAEAAVVRRADGRWGEVPVAFVAVNSPEVTAEQLTALCLEHLARHKVPKEFRFVEPGSMPRNTSGKIIRQELERELAR